VESIGAEEALDVRLYRHPYLGRKYHRVLRRLLYLTWLNLVAPTQHAAAGIDVVHFTNFYIPFWRKSWRRAGYVATIHDLVPWTVPQTLPEKAVRFHKWTVKWAIQCADQIITPTETVKKEILEWLPGVRREKVVACCYTYRHHNQIEPDGSANRDSKQNRYFLFVGTLERRKNVVTLVRAFSMLLKGSGRRDLLLWLIGKQGFGFDEIKAAIREEALGDCVRIGGYVEQSQIGLVYNSALALIMPSLYEGFGIPVLEGMWHGTPVIASDIPVFREIAGDAALFYGLPLDRNGLASSMERVLLDADLCTELTTRGRAHAARFSSNRVATEHLAAYEHLLKDAGQRRFALPV